jgi:2-polyprenyl-3-methyl-5-hydroxy-6-metoxy-1,4-benzoquinol methylase
MNLSKETQMNAEPSSVDVAEILEQLRESVRQQQPTGALSAREQPARWRRWELLFDKVQRAGQVNPHLPIAWPEWPRGLLPKALALLQKIVRRFLRWYINPIVEQQNTYNQAVIDALGELVGQVKLAAEQSNRLDDEVRASLTRTAVLNQRLRRLEQKPGSVPMATPTAEISGTKPPGEPADDPGLDYFMLELRYRGAPELIRERQAAYLPEFAGRRAVLDIGCGRGEFVEMLREKGVDARGIDLDPDAVAYCQERGLPVTQAEATIYLNGLQDGALDGIFMAQVAEHLAPSTLQRVLTLASAKMRPGGILVAETVNPLCLYALVNHYLIDPSHVRPLHPELFKFMIESAGFGQAEVRYLSPTPDEIRLHHQAVPPDAASAERERIALTNRNTDKLNSLLFGYQDYAVLAIRPPRDPWFQESREGDDG